MGILAIHHIQLPFPAGLERQMTAFYEGLLGLVRLPHVNSSVLRLAAGSQRLDLVPSSGGPAQTASHVAFETTDLPALRRRFVLAQWPLVENQALPGYLRFYVKDPAGNQLEVLQPDEEGGLAP